MPVCLILALEPSGLSLLGFQISTTVLLLILMGLEGIFEGVTLPTSNNACIELMPHRVATIISMVSIPASRYCSQITVGSVILHTLGSPGLSLCLWWSGSLDGFHFAAVYFCHDQR